LNKTREFTIKYYNSIRVFSSHITRQGFFCSF